MINQPEKPEGLDQQKPEGSEVQKAMGITKNTNMTIKNTR